MREKDDRKIIELYCLSIDGNCHRCVLKNQPHCYGRQADNKDVEMIVDMLVKFGLVDKSKIR